MESGKIKLSLAVVLFVIALIVITVLGIMVFTLNQKNKENENKISQLQNTFEGTNTTAKNEIKNNTNTVKTNKKEYVIDTSDEKTEYKEYDSEVEGIEGIYLTEVIDNDDDTYTLRGAEITFYSFDEDLLKQYKEEGFMTLDGIKYNLDEVDGGRDGVLFWLTEEGKDDSLYEIIQKEENLYGLERMAQITDVYQFTENLVEITVDKDTFVTSDFDDDFIPHDPFTVENQLSTYKSKTLKLTKDDILERTINSDDMGNCYKIIFDKNGKVNNLDIITLGI